MYYSLSVHSFEIFCLLITIYYLKMVVKYIGIVIYLTSFQIKFCVPEPNGKAILKKNRLVQGKKAENQTKMREKVLCNKLLP